MDDDDDGKNDREREREDKLKQVHGRKWTREKGHMGHMNNTVGWGWSIENFLLFCQLKLIASTSSVHQVFSLHYTVLLFFCFWLCWFFNFYFVGLFKWSPFEIEVRFHRR